MLDGSREPVFKVAFLIVLLCSTFGASSQVGSNLTTTIPSPGSPGCYLDDRCTLLTFKKGLLNEGEPALASWSSDDVSLWKGVTWKTVDGTVYVEKLELGALLLNGTIGPLLEEGLTNLTFLNISGNFLTAKLPDPLRICPALLVLDLSNNSFFGSLPQAWSCDDTVNSSAPLNSATFSSINLQVLNLSKNNFSGEVSSSLFSSLSSGRNGGSLGNLTSLVLDNNAFRGNFPSSVGNCTQLVELKLSYNRFTGIFPFVALQKLSKLETVDATSNYIAGNLLPIDGGSFGQLKSFSLGYNLLTGGIPESLGNLSNLQTLELKYNNLTGLIPKTLAKLANLQTLSLQWNDFNGTIPEEFSQLSNLTSLSLNHNKLSGSISPSLSNCTNLKSIWLSEAHLSGTIPPELGNLTSLVVLSLYGNLFNGTIPEELGRLRTLVAFDLSYNKLVGRIPVGLCDLFRLQVLLLNNNQLNDSIPDCFGNFTYLRIVDLSTNALSGSFPSDLSNLSMNVQSLSKAPDELSTATYIQALAGQNLVYEFSQSPISFAFTNNFLSGQIPIAFGSIQHLQLLRLSSNNLSGSIPDALGNASALYWLDLSYNDLSGGIPPSLTHLHFLSFLNLSFNNLSGQIPEQSQFETFNESSFSGNPYLCGFPLLKCTSAGPPNGRSQGPGGSRSEAKKLLPLYITLGSAVICLCFLGGLFAWSWIRGCSRRNSSLVSNDGDMCQSKDDLQFFQVTISSVLPSLNPKELALATENYHENNIIGDGGFGLVYRAVLNCGSVVAVKKLLEDGAQGQNEFLAEMRTLGNIKHRNLVSLLGYCAYGKERILVYEYMKNGSLDTWLHCRDEGMSSLDWRTRLKVARGAAEGLAFLHHGANPTIIHRDIKASNILLDCEFEARLADFGLARSARAYESHVSTDFAGTAGYIPPEYSQGSAATTKGDVYSFGVVLLEILTGRRPTDPFFKKKEMSHVVTWILDMSMEEAIEKTLDMSSAASTDEMLELMRIACLCCQDMPSKRPNMGQVVRMLDALERQQSPSRSPSVVLYDESMSSPRCR